MHEPGEENRVTIEERKDYAALKLVLYPGAAGAILFAAIAVLMASQGFGFLEDGTTLPVQVPAGAICGASVGFIGGSFLGFVAVLFYSIIRSIW